MAAFSLLDILKEYLGTDLPKIGVLDVGAMSLGEGTDAHSPLLARDACTVVGFEPVQEEHAKLVQLNTTEKPAAIATVKHKFLPYFIGNGKPAKFYRCNEAMTSSLYEPNTELVEQYSHLSEVMRVVETSDVQTTRLDDILTELGEVDFVKLDVQGAELDVIHGGRTALADACVVQTEVEFVHLYKNQPLFADVDAAMRELGFTFHRFMGIAGRTLKPMVVVANPFQPISQQLWADAIYVRDMLELKSVSSDKLLKMAVILHEIYQSYDLVLHVLRTYGERVKQNGDTNRPLHELYMERLFSVQQCGV